MWRHILVTIILTAHGALGQFQEEEDPFHASAEQLRVLARTWDADYRDLHGLAANEPSVGSLGARRLFGIPGIYGESETSFTKRGITEMCDSALSWVENTSSSVLGGVYKALGVDDAIELFKSATKWVKKGVEVAKKAWDCMTKLEGKLLHIFNDFKPLQPIFANENGLISLITNQTNVGTLVHVVKHLLNTSSDLDELGGFVHSVSDMFKEISDLFRGALGRVIDDENTQPVAARRLDGKEGPHEELVTISHEAVTNYKELMQNLDFKKLVPLLLGFMKDMQEHSNDLLMVKDILEPLLIQLDASESSSGQPARRLSGSPSLEEIMKDQQKYARAIKAIIPTWQGIEKTGIAMCPVVGESDGSSGSLKCRVEEFIEKAALPSWAQGAASKISGLIGACPEPTGNSTVCPTESQSAGITDLLGKNAEYIGWLVALCVAALGLLGFGTLAAVKKKASGQDEYSEQEDTDEES